MASVAITISGMLYDKLNRTQQNVVLIGQASLTDLTVGGGPIIPPIQPPSGPVDPGYGYPEYPVDPGYGVPEKPPTIWGPTDPRPTPPIYIPPPLPPEVTVPPPGSPPIAIGGNQPVAPIVPPPFIVVTYPGIGKVLVPQPSPPPEAQPKK